MAHTHTGGHLGNIRQVGRICLSAEFEGPRPEGDEDVSERGYESFSLLPARAPHSFYIEHATGGGDGRKRLRRVGLAVPREIGGHYVVL
jgi:hypothetical protein